MKGSAKEFCAWVREQSDARQDVVAKVVSAPESCNVAHLGIGAHQSEFRFEVGMSLRRFYQDGGKATVVKVSGITKPKHIPDGVDDLEVEWDDGA